MPVARRRHPRVHRRGAPARLGVRRDSRWTPTAARDVVFSGDLGRFSRPVLPDPSRGRDGRRPARRIDLRRPHARAGRRRRAPRRDHHDDDRGRREGDHPGVRDRPRRGGDLLAEAARGGAADSRRAGLRGQPDGGRRPAALREPQPTTSTPTCRRGRGQMGAFTTRRFTAVASPQQSKEIQASAVALHRHLGERDGDGRARAAPPEGRAAPEAQHRALRGLPGRRDARPPAARGRRDGQDPRPVQVPVAARIERIDSMSAHADADEIMQWLRGFTRAPRMTYVVHGEPAAQDGAEGPHRAGARMAGAHARSTWSRSRCERRRTAGPTCSSASTTRRWCSCTRTASTSWRRARRRSSITCRRPRWRAATSTTTSATRRASTCAT